jgi:hypothetical protein
MLHGHKKGIDRRIVTKNFDFLTPCYQLQLGEFGFDNC